MKALSFLKQECMSVKARYFISGFAPSDLYSFSYNQLVLVTPCPVYVLLWHLPVRIFGQ